MISEEKQDIERIRKDFYKLRADNKLSKPEYGNMVADITQLIGIYAVDRDKEIASLLEEVLSFAEKNSWAVEGFRAEFERIKKGGTPK